MGSMDRLSKQGSEGYECTDGGGLHRRLERKIGGCSIYEESAWEDTECSLGVGERKSLRVD